MFKKHTVTFFLVSFSVLVLILGFVAGSVCNKANEQTLLWTLIFGIAFIAGMAGVTAYNTKIISEEAKKQTELLEKFSENFNKNIK